jgi:tetratricopeptide (TPR) repeat protein
LTIPTPISAIFLLSSMMWAQQSGIGWQEKVRRGVQAQDWTAAMQIVDQELARAPQDLEIRSWRARLLLWSGRLSEAEREYREILQISASDPDYWVGLATVYLREGHIEDANQALRSAVVLDPSRADVHVLRGRVLEAAHDLRDARVEFLTALNLEPASQEARSGLLSLNEDPKHELRLGIDSDLFSFTESDIAQGLSLTSRWNPHFRTNAIESYYRVDSTPAEKFGATMTGISPRWGAFSLGGAFAHDNGVIPKHEFITDYDRGWRLGSPQIRGFEIECMQHWYWYTTAQILTINETATVYLPDGWMWSLGFTAARSSFYGSGTGWRPSGMSRLNFPILGKSSPSLFGKLFFAAGTENFSRVDQIGHFSSQSYGGGVRFQFTNSQNVTGTAAFQKRTGGRTATSFGLQYGIRF